jgi:hypothetical protein
VFRKTPPGSCSQTCVLSPSYNTFCRNLQKWNLSCFENALLVVLILNFKLWHVRSNYSPNCYKTNVVWNFIYKNFSFIHFCSKNNMKIFKGSFHVDIYISHVWVCFFPEMRCYYLKNIGSLVKKSTSLENEFWAKLFLQKSCVLVLSITV